MKQSLDEEKAVLLAGLRQVRVDIHTTALQFHPGEETIPFVGVWSLLDLLAHLAGWDVTNRLAVQEVLAGTLPMFYQYLGKDWADYNAMLVSKYRVDSVAEMLAVLTQTHQALLADLEALPAKALFADHGVRRGSYRVIISRLLEAEHKDEVRHLEQIVEFIHEQHG